MENKQNLQTNPQINYPYFHNTPYVLNNNNNQPVNNFIQMKNHLPMHIPYQNFNNPMFFQQSSHIPPQYLNNYKAYYNPIIYQTYLSGGYHGNQGVKVAYPLQQINNQNISYFFSSPYTINYNTAKSNQFFSQTNSNTISGNNSVHNNNYQRKNNHSNNYIHNPNRHREERGDSIKKSATDILNIESKVLEDPVEIEKWILSRKRNFPSEKNKIEKQEKGKIRENAGMLSTLEATLRERLKIMNQIDRKKFVRRRTFKRRRSKRNKKPKNSEPEQGEIKPENEENKNFAKEENQESKTGDGLGKFKLNTNNMFKYKKNKIYDNMIKNEKIKEMNVILQCFRYFVNENLV